MSKSLLVAGAAVVSLVVVVFVLQAARGLAQRSEEQKQTALIAGEPFTGKPSGFVAFRKGKAKGAPYQTGKLLIGVGVAALAATFLFYFVSRQRKRAEAQGLPQRPDGTPYWPTA